MYKLCIKKFRHMRGLTQEELADMCNLSASYISRLEADNIIRTRTPTLVTIEKLAIALQVCGKDLIYYDCNGCQLYEDCPKKDRVNLNEIIEENLHFYI